MASFRVGVFSRRTDPTEGGADTFAATLGEKLRALSLGPEIELVPVAWEAWSQRRKPLSYVARRVLQLAGVEIPEVDLRPLCRELRLDAAYFTTPAFVAVDLPYVFTLWDLGHRTVPQFPEMQRGRMSWAHREALCQRMLPRARFVVVGNRAGAAEVRRYFNVPEDRLVPVPFPNPDFSAVAAVAPPWLPGEPFFFYPAQLWPHKNHTTLLKALAGLAQAGRPVPRLVFVGSDQGNLAALRAEAAVLGIAERVHFAGFVPRGVLKHLYQHATGLVFASLLGPNNLPPQEAAVLGCPMILSDLPGHREQLGDGALYASGLDAAAWGDAIHRLQSSPELRGQLVSRAAAAVAGCTTDAYLTQIGRLLVRLAPPPAA